MFGSAPFSAAPFSSLAEVIHFGEFAGTMTFTQSSDSSVLMSGEKDLTFSVVQTSRGTNVRPSGSLPQVASFNQLANGMVFLDGQGLLTLEGNVVTLSSVLFLSSSTIHSAFTQTALGNADFSGVSGMAFTSIQTTAAKTFLDGQPSYTIEFIQGSAGNYDAVGVSQQTLELIQGSSSSVIFTTDSGMTFALVQTTDGERLWELSTDAGNEQWSLLASQGSGSWTLDSTSGSGTWTPESLSPGGTWQDEDTGGSEAWDVVTRN
jgi:hypothetical protein